MSAIAQLNLLLRVRAELPEDFRLETEEFREGWSLSRSLDDCCLEKTILNRGWNFIKIDDGPQGCGVGETSHEAVAHALAMALRRIDEYFNVVEVAHIHLTQYPWFLIARVKVCPFRIQQGAVVSIPEIAGRSSAAPERKRSSRRRDELNPHCGSEMTSLKDMLTVSNSTNERAQ
jgi:hypothetical protein